jgi:hypothetical protein
MLREARSKANFMVLSWGALIITAFLFFVLVEGQDKRPAFGANGFINSNGFLRVQPETTQSFLTKGIRDQVELFENYRKEGSSYVPFIGRIETTSFRPSLFMVLPLKSSAINRRFKAGEAVASVVCEANGQTISLLSHPALDWSERRFSVAKDWCPGQVKIVAEVSKAGVSIGIGSPFRVSALYYYTIGFTGYIISLLLCSVVVSALVLPPLLMKSGGLLIRFSASSLIVFSYGYALYYAAFLKISQDWLLLINISMLILPCFVMIVLWAVKRVQIDLSVVRYWLLSLIAVGSIILLSIAIGPTDISAWTPNNTFYPVTWSTDNQLPIMMAKYVLDTGQISPPYLGAWSVTDRGIAPAGGLMGLLLLLKSLGIYEQNPIVFALAHVFQSLLQGLVVPFAVLLFRDRWNNQRLLLLTIGLCTTPFLFFNVYYVWPKLLAGLYGIMALLLLASGVQERKSLHIAIAILCLAAGYLNHSAILIALPMVPLFVLCLLITGEGSWANWLAIAKTGRQLTLILGAAALGTSAIIAQSAIAEGSSYGVTFMLTGRGIFGLKRDGVIEFAKQYFENMTAGQLLELKFTQLKSLFYLADPAAVSYCKDVSPVGCVRAMEFFSLIPALSVLPIALYILSIAKRCTIFSCDTVERQLSVIGCLSALNILAMAFVFGVPMITHHIPYFLVLGILLGGLSQLPSRMDRAGVAAYTLHILSFGLIWILPVALAWHARIGF